MWYRLAGAALVIWGLVLASWGAAHLRDPPWPTSPRGNYVTTGQLEDVTCGTVMAVLGVIVYRRKSEWWWR